MQVDDARGVGENLNETMCACRDCGCGGLMVRGTMRLVVGTPNSVGAHMRRHMQHVNDPPVMALAQLAPPPSSPPPCTGAAAGTPAASTLARSERSESAAAVYTVQPLCAHQARPPPHRRPGLRPQLSFVREALPPNVALITLQRTGRKRLLVRLGHLYQVGCRFEFEITQMRSVVYSCVWRGSSDLGVHA